MGLAGIAPGDYTYVDYIVSKESNWNPSAQNASGAYGLCQAFAGQQMASAGSDWASNPVTQLRWCNSCAVGHYGSWAGAYSFWVSQMVVETKSRWASTGYMTRPACRPW